MAHSLQLVTELVPHEVRSSEKRFLLEEKQFLHESSLEPTRSFGSSECEVLESKDQRNTAISRPLPIGATGLEVISFQCESNRIEWARGFGGSSH